MKKIATFIILLAVAIVGAAWGQGISYPPPIPKSYLKTNIVAPGSNLKVPSEKAVVDYVALFGAGAFADLTGQPTDNTNLATALGLKLTSAFADPASGGYTGITLTYPATTGGLSKYNTVYLTSAGTWAKANSAAAETAKTWGVVTADAAEAADCVVLMCGKIRNDSWSAMTVGAPFYTSNATAGLITGTAPTTVGHYVQPVAWATAAKILFVNPDSTIVEIGTGLTTEAQLSFTDLTTADATTSVHGLMPKLDKIKIDQFSPASGKTLTVSKTIAFTCADDTAVATLPAGANTLVGVATVQTLSNKTITSRVVDQVNNDATMTSGNAEYNVDNADMFTWTALAQGTDFGVPGGTPVSGQKIVFRITGTAARALTWNAVFVAGTDIALPTTTTTIKTMYLQFMYSSAASAWHLVSKLDGF